MLRFLERKLRAPSVLKYGAVASVLLLASASTLAADCNGVNEYGFTVKCNMEYLNKAKHCECQGTVFSIQESYKREPLCVVTTVSKP